MELSGRQAGVGRYGLVWIESWSVERSRGSKCLHLLLCLVFVWHSSSRTWSTKRSHGSKLLERRFQSVFIYSSFETTFFVDMGGVIKEDVLAHPDLRSFLSPVELKPNSSGHMASSSKVDALLSKNSNDLNKELEVSLSR